MDYLLLYISYLNGISSERDAVDACLSCKKQASKVFKNKTTPIINMMNNGGPARKNKICRGPPKTKSSEQGPPLFMLSADLPGRGVSEIPKCFCSFREAHERFATRCLAHETSSPPRPWSNSFQVQCRPNPPPPRSSRPPTRTAAADNQ